MKVSTAWSFRKQHLNTYQLSDFANDWDYFVYLHLNRGVQYLHLGGTLIGLGLFPWAMIKLFRDHLIWPTVVYTFFYYGVGFISHWTCDGQISGTWRYLLRTYKQAAQMNLLVISGKVKKEEERFLNTYPHTLWVYDSRQTKPVSIV